MQVGFYMYHWTKSIFVKEKTRIEGPKDITPITETNSTRKTIERSEIKKRSHLNTLEWKNAHEEATIKKIKEPRALRFQSKRTGNVPKEEHPYQ